MVSNWIGIKMSFNWVKIDDLPSFFNLEDEDGIKKIEFDMSLVLCWFSAIGIEHRMNRK